MILRITKAALVSLVLCELSPGHESPEDAHKELRGKFVIKEVIRDTEKAREFYPAASPFVGKMFAVKVEFIGDAPEWFGSKPRWIQSLSHPGKIEVGKQFRGEVHFDPKFGFHLSCFSPIQFYLEDAEQGTGEPATRADSDSEGGQKPQPESEGRSR